MTEYKIADAGDLHKYFTQVPNIVDDLKLSVCAFRLYFHLKRVAGDAGICYQSGGTLAKSCGMSTGAVSKAKKELQVAGLITVEVKSSDKNIYHEITIVDIWSANIKQYSVSPGEGHSHNEGHSLSEEIPSPGEVDRSPGETKNNTINNNPEEKNNPIAGKKKMPAQKVPAQEVGLSQGQKDFLKALGAKRFKNNVQRDAVLALERTYGTARLKECVTWAAESGMDLGRAIHAVQKAIQSWGQPKQNFKGHTNGETGSMGAVRRALEKRGIPNG